MFSLFIMHFLTYVFIPADADTDEAVGEAMKPYGDEFPVKPWKRYPGPRETGAMAKHYGLRRSASRKLAALMKDWCGHEGGVDERGLFALSTSNPDAKWDWYEIGGRWQGKLPNDVASCHSLLLRPARLRTLLPHDFLTPDGKWHAAERYVPGDWAIGRFVRKSPSRWLAEFTRALTRHRDHRIVCVDRHD
ncbi:MAG: hypothetical protein ACRC33_29860 [Gemmataceae bacterium]